MSTHTAGIIVIGDEILKGQTVDTNSPFMCKRLHALGVKLCKISVVPDDVDVIASETLIFSKAYDIVLTSGGIGPTHDDVTYEAVAKAFNTPLVLNKEIAELIGMFFHGSTTDVIENPALKMAMIPESATLIYPRDTTKRRKRSLTFYDMPTVRVSNVYIFPGLPNSLEYAFSQLEHLFNNLDNRKFYVRCLYFNRGETELVPCLNRAVETFKNDVTFGSYPIVENDVYCTKITMESVTEERVLEAENFLKKELPAVWIVNPDSLSAESVIVSVYDTAVSVPNSRLTEMVKNSLKVLTECFEKFSAREVFISFNGGKDCTVLLHLACAVLWSQQPQERQNRLQALYIRYSDPFPEVEKFIEETVLRYNLELKVVPSPIKVALEVVLEERTHLKAVLMGTRRTDPYAETLQPFQMTDSGWPQVMRVNPLLDWDYQDVWGFLQLLGIPYCTLYDDGYTSIGSRHNTTPNPQLKYTDSSGETRYQPAFMLQDGTAERNGREFNLESAVQEAEELGALLSRCFGPGGRAALVQQPTGQLTVTRCGWAVLKAVYEDDQEPPNPIRRLLLECAGKIENCLGDGVKCFVFMLAALLKHVQQLQGPRSRLVTELGRLQMSVARLTFLESGAAVADHCTKITSTFFHTRFPVSVSSSLEQMFHEWLSCYLTHDCDITSTLQHLYKNFAVLCLYQKLGSRSVFDSRVVAGFLVSRAAFNLCTPGPHIISVLLFGADSDGALDEVDVECEVNSFLSDVSDDVPTLLLTSRILSDLMLFGLRRKNVAVLHGVPQAEAEYVSSLLQRNVPVEVKSAVEGTQQCTWLGLPDVNHLILCGPTETLSREYASCCLGAIRLLLVTAKHRTLVEAGGWFERTLNFKLMSKLETVYQRPSVFSITSRAELLTRHQQYRNLKEEGDKIEKLSSGISLLSCCDSEKELDSLTQALLCTDREVVLAIAGSLLVVPRKLDKSPWCGRRQAFESLAFKAQIIQHVISAAVQILRIGSTVNISKASKAVPHR